MYDYEEIKNESDKQIPLILDSLGIEYQFQSGWIATKCPFHNSEKLNLKYKNRTFYCFSECNCSYTILDYVAKVKDTSIEKAVEWLASLLKIKEGYHIKTGESYSIKDGVKSLFKYKKMITNTNDKQDLKPVEQTILNDLIPYKGNYLKKQGIPDSTIKEFGISYALGGELENRIVFPIDDINGRIVSLTGRMINYEDIGSTKYHIVANSNSKQTLYNISRVAKNCKKYDFVIVVEGMKSVLKMFGWGWENGVATLGASMSKDQAMLLIRLGVKIVVIGDNDSAGERLMQSVDNQCGRFLDVIKCDISKVTEQPKAGVDDLTEQQFDKLLKIYRLEDIKVNGNINI